jgi:hypothetical protein
MESGKGSGVRWRRRTSSDKDERNARDTRPDQERALFDGESAT